MATSGVGTTASSPRDLFRIADSYSYDLPTRPCALHPRSPDAHTVVLMTGTTGNFGCNVLEHLLQDDSVKKIYAVNRMGTQNVSDRQAMAFRNRGLDESLLHSSKLQMVEADFATKGLGIEANVLEEIRLSVTCIIHNAWSSNFILPLSSFDVFLSSLRWLVELALSSPFVTPPKVQFISSVAVFQRCTDSLRPLPEESLDPAWALGTGYGESKWVAERMLLNVHQETQLPIQIVRIGQLCGDDDGHWNEGEWFPAVVKSALTTGSGLPTIHGVAAFLPNSAAARALVEMRASPSLIVHLVHPRPGRLQTLFACVADELSLPRVSYEKWTAALADAAQSIATAAAAQRAVLVRENPVVLLLEFVASRMFTTEGEMLPFVELATENARAASETLEYLPEMQEHALVLLWLGAWRETGFLPAN